MFLLEVTTSTVPLPKEWEDLFNLHLAQYGTLVVNAFIVISLICCLVQQKIATAILCVLNGKLQILHKKLV